MASLFSRMLTAGPLWKAMRSRFVSIITGINAVMSAVAGMNPHKVDDTTIVAGTATDLATTGALLQALVTSYEAHRASTTYHLAADTTNAVASATLTATLAGYITGANDLKAKLNAHIAEFGTSHCIKDASLIVTQANATELVSLEKLALALQSTYMAHRNRAGRFAAVGSLDLAV